MKLVFDTNIIHEDFHLVGPRITKLCSAAEKLGYELMVPDMVVDEMVNQYRKKMFQNLTGYARVLKMVARTHGNEDNFDKDIFLESKVQEYESFLRKRIKELNIKTIAYPKIDAKMFISKELKAKKPFREISGGTIGICDSIIWETLKSVCTPPQDLIEDPQIEFLSANTKDFAGTDGSLHPDLVLELTSAGLAENCVALVSDIDDFFKNTIDPELEELKQIQNALLKHGKYNRFIISEELSKALNQDYINRVINESDFESGDHYYLPRYMEDPTINYVNEPTVEEVSVRQLSDQTVLVEIKAKVTADMDYFVYKPDYYIYEDERDVSIVDDNWNDYYMLCEGSALVYTDVSFRTTAKLGKTLSVDVQVKEVDV